MLAVPAQAAGTGGGPSRCAVRTAPTFSLGPRTSPRQTEEPFTTRPPKTDRGTISNLTWSFTDSHMRLENGGWARQTTVRELETGPSLAAG